MPQVQVFAIQQRDGCISQQYRLAGRGLRLVRLVPGGRQAGPGDASAAAQPVQGRA